MSRVDRAEAAVEKLGLHDHAGGVSAVDRNQRRLRGERVAFLRAPASRCDSIATELSAAGLPVGHLLANGQLVLGSAAESISAWRLRTANTAV
ncbi:hypothetical protein [Actinoplanes subtropicus]|uniref:hypothetical protein n=1 Tax=Actinoplanes subtropicus TaxID=543632 RepID=UPI001FE163AD|nr:hypothetical protein [Actinoplanes subtropicus]